MDDDIPLYTDDDAPDEEQEVEPEDDWGVIEAPEYEWIERNITTKVDYLWTGTIGGARRTSWHQWGFDDKPEAVARQVTKISTGKVVGAHKDGTVFYMTEGDQPYTLLDGVVERGPVEWLDGE